MTLRHQRLAVASMALALLASPASLAADPAGSSIVARDGNNVITTADVNAMLADLDPQVRQRVLSSTSGLVDLVRTRLATRALLAEADSKSWASHPDVATEISRARDGVIEQTYLASVSQPEPSYPTDTDLQNAYDANRAKFEIPKQDHLADVLIPGAANAPPRKPPAALYATGTPNDLGLIPESRLAPVIRSAIAGVPVGGVSTPVHLDDGWHVIKLIAIKPASTQTLAEVRPQLVDALRRQREQQKARAYLGNLQTTQHLQVNEIALSSMVRK